mmetsp:Transcript_14840/g.39948  ORF Transcript_14840/g.39948 Transcript_14840/m.39948 type:complete len:299 (+) Transcript_14840:177-1073(+)
MATASSRARLREPCSYRAHCSDASTIHARRRRTTAWGITLDFQTSSRACEPNRSATASPSASCAHAWSCTSLGKAKYQRGLQRAAARSSLARERISGSSANCLATSIGVGASSVPPGASTSHPALSMRITSFVLAWRRSLCNGVGPALHASRTHSHAGGKAIPSSMIAPCAQRSVTHSAEIALPSLCFNRWWRAVRPNQSRWFTSSPCLRRRRRRTASPLRAATMRGWSSARVQGLSDRARSAVDRTFSSARWRWGVTGGVTPYLSRWDRVQGGTAPASTRRSKHSACWRTRGWVMTL